MITAIKQNPFLSLGFVSLLLAVVLWDATGDLNPFTVFFGLYALFLLFLNSVRFNRKLQYKKIDRKAVKKQMNRVIEEEAELEDPNRKAVFIGLGKTVITPETLREMSYKEDPNLKAFVALNPQTPADILLEYSLDTSDEGILACVAANPKTATSVADKLRIQLMDDFSSKTEQMDILNDPNSNPHLLKQVFLNPFNADIVNELLLEHSNTPEDVINEITNTENHDFLVRLAKSKKVIDNAKLINRLKAWVSYDIMLGLFTNPNINRRTLELYNAFDQSKDLVNAIVRDRNKGEFTLPPASLAYIGRSAPIYKKTMGEIIQQNYPEYANVPYDDLMKIL